MAIVQISSRIVPERGHWSVTVRDESGVLDVDGIDTGPTYSAVVAEGEPWSVMEAKLADQVAEGRKRAADETKLPATDMVSLNALVDGR